MGYSAGGEGVQHFGGAAAVGLADLVAEPLQVRPVLPPPMQDAAGGLLLHSLDHPAIDALALHLLGNPPPLRSRMSLRSSASPGSGSSVAISAARDAAKGRRAGQMCSVEMCPCRTFFSCTESTSAAVAELTMAQTSAETDREALVALYNAAAGPNLE